MIALNSYWRPITIFILALSLFAPWMSSCAYSHGTGITEKPYYLTDWRWAAMTGVSPGVGVGPGYVKPEVFIGFELIPLFIVPFVSGNWANGIAFPFLMPAEIAIICLIGYALVSAGTWILATLFTPNSPKSRFTMNVVMAISVRSVRLILVSSTLFWTMILESLYLLLIKVPLWHLSGALLATLTMLACAVLEIWEIWINAQGQQLGSMEGHSGYDIRRAVRPG